jgi:hypothetical protein
VSYLNAVAAAALMLDSSTQQGCMAMSAAEQQEAHMSYVLNDISACLMVKSSSFLLHLHTCICLCGSHSNMPSTISLRHTPRLKSLCSYTHLYRLY